MKGRISTLLTLICGGCSDFEYLDTVRKTQAAKEARHKGWKLTKKLGWLCPSCQGAGGVEERG
jgi:hypothetical protein